MTLEEVKIWWESFFESQTGKDYMQWLNNELYPPIYVEMDNQNQFHVDNLEPGRYSLSGKIERYSNLDMQDNSTLIARVWYEFEVPPITDNRQLDIPMDLGPIRVYTGHLKPGDPAPNFDLPTFETDRIQLSAYRGKVLLLSFTDTENTVRDITSLNDIKEIYHTYKEHPHYAQVSIHYSAFPVIDKKAIEASGLDWPHAIGDIKKPKERITYDVPDDRLPWNILIDPDGHILSVGLEGEALGQAIEQALSEMDQ
jgi:hypothetical protein